MSNPRRRCFTKALERIHEQLNRRESRSYSRPFGHRRRGHRCNHQEPNASPDIRIPRSPVAITPIAPVATTTIANSFQIANRPAYLIRRFGSPTADPSPTIRQPSAPDPLSISDYDFPTASEPVASSPSYVPASPSGASFETDTTIANPFQLTNRPAYLVRRLGSPTAGPSRTNTLPSAPVSLRTSDYNLSTIISDPNSVVGSPTYSPGSPCTLSDQVSSSTASSDHEQVADSPLAGTASPLTEQIVMGPPRFNPMSPTGSMLGDSPPGGRLSNGNVDGFANGIGNACQNEPTFMNGTDRYPSESPDRSL